MRDLIGRLVNRLRLNRRQVESTVALFDDDNTVPFVARYRKEMTGGLDEMQLEALRKELEALRKLAARQDTVIRSIEEQGKLTEQLAEQIESAETMTELEDLYLPYKPRRRTRAQAARERGLEPMAGWILEQLTFTQSLAEVAGPYLSEEVPDVEAAWAGARDIVAETISEDARVREAVRQVTWNRGVLDVGAAEPEKDPKRVFESYYTFTRTLKEIKPHQVLALNRGEAEGVLKVNLPVSTDGMARLIQRFYPPRRESPLAAQLGLAIDDSYERLIGPAMEREVRRQLTEWADEHAISVFSTNLRGLLLTPPIKGLTVLGIDPGYRTGCKIAVVDATGRLLDVGTIYPHPPQNESRRALDVLHDLVRRYAVGLITIGNGTASRETEELVARLIGEMGEAGRQPAQYLIVNEAGASVYSASELARAEFPDLDVSLRGAVSIARRAQDPLAELVKIDPKSIGVGMYQHDVDQKALGEALDHTVERVVNAVGVDLNTASPALLRHVAGLGPKLAEAIVQHRDAHGPFVSRESVRKVKGLGPRAFEQAAGFLRVPEAANLLDNTGVHPESYEAALALLRTLGIEPNAPDLPELVARAQKSIRVEEVAAQIGAGEPTLRDIITELQRPGRDPREDVPAPVLRSDVLQMEDLRPGMKLKGTVRNVIDFGAFVDIGVKQDGLVHISQLADRRVDSPYEVLNVGDVVEVTVVSVDLERGRIGLSMRSNPQIGR